MKWTSALLCVSALLLCFSALHARPRLACRCVRTSAQPMNVTSVRKIEVFPISGSCRRMEIRITRNNGRVVCADPNLEWVKMLLQDAQRMKTQSQLGINQM